MELDEMLQRMRGLRFPSIWDGCTAWASGLISWQVSQRPSSWAPVVDDQKTFIDYTSSVIACALHATAVEHGLDAEDGADLLSIPLEQAAARLADEPLTMLREAMPANAELASLLHSIPHWIEEMDENAREQGQFIIEQARAVLTLHAEYGYAVGDRLRAVLEESQALDSVLAGNPGEADPQVNVYSRAQRLELHQMAIANLEAMCLADDQAGQVSYAGRQLLLERGAFNDRVVLGLGTRASDDQRDLALHGARNLLAWDRSHTSHTGPVPAGDPRWTDDPLGYLRQEYTVALDRLSQPLL